jgi:hypothetical protein
VQDQDNSEHDESIELTDAWWEALGPRALHPIRVQIIESLRWIGKPLHALELSEIIDGVVWAVPDLHLRQHKALGAVALVNRPVCLHMQARYRLVVE